MLVEIGQIEKTPREHLDERMISLCDSITSKRARTVITHIMDHGIVTTDDLRSMYDHPPRAIRDVRDNGIPIITHSVINRKTGRRMGAYTFGDISKIRGGRIGGRKAFSKKFKQDLIERHGSRDMITGEIVPERYLQIDHRVPYDVNGDATILDLDDFMLVDASSNRAKSWSCEHCANQRIECCKTCFWAFPENYEHVAGTPSRRIDMTWDGDEEVLVYTKLHQAASNAGITLAEYIKQLLATGTKYP